MEKEKLIWINPKELKLDKCNPNSMSKQLLEALALNIQRFGWNMPIIVDQDLVVADGEQKLAVALEKNWSEVPILKRNYTEAERKIVRQSMNKLRGSHDELLDKDEFIKILGDKNIGMEGLTSLTGLTEQSVLNLLNKEERPLDEAEGVSNKLYSLEIECPFCHKKWKKSKEEK